MVKSGLRRTGYRHIGVINVVNLGKKVPTSIPKAILVRLEVEGEQIMVVDTTNVGAIVMRPAGIYPVEIYSEDRISGGLAEDELPSEVGERARYALAQCGHR